MKKKKSSFTQTLRQLENAVKFLGPQADQHCCYSISREDGNSPEFVLTLYAYQQRRGAN